MSAFEWLAIAYLFVGVLASVLAGYISHLHEYPFPWWRYPLLALGWLPALAVAIWKRGQAS